MKILIADDDPATRFILEDSLSEWEYEVISVSDGEQAWEVLHNEGPPRMAVIDWLMPGIDGVTLCKRVKEEKDKPFIYIILLTGKSDTEDVVEGLNAGADDFLKKPVDLSELRSRLAVGARTLKYEEMLLESERKVRVECYNALSALAEARDNETGQHLKRICLYSRLLSERLGMNRQFMKDIEIFSAMHDIGKVGIPDEILLAPRKLSSKEFEVMKTHTTLGYQILSGRTTFEMAEDIAHYHHEKFNGKGYPEGLKGEAIPMCGRIVALVDVYDALCSKRPYKESWSHADAVNLIKNEREEHFDPVVTDAFLKDE
ncbi:MAG: HD domain-containing phosphohydrolase, partial [Thermodesulfobacteriota bacterium]